MWRKQDDTNVTVEIWGEMWCLSSEEGKSRKKNIVYSQWSMFTEPHYLSALWDIHMQDTFCAADSATQAAGDKTFTCEMNFNAWT